jgi:putative ABC transport system substrate-binding protein
MKALGILGLITFFVARCDLIEAQEAIKPHRVGWLGIGSASSVARYGEFRRALNDLGYVEGKNILVEYRSADNRLDRLPSLATELVRLNVDVIVTRGTPEAVALKNVTRTIPIVFYDVTDPVGAGLVDSLAKPGGNMTGFSGMEAALIGKRLALLKEIFPKLSRVAVLWNPQDLSSEQQWKASQLPAKELGLQLHSIEVDSADGYARSFDDTIKARNEALLIIAGALEDTNSKRIVELAEKYRLIAIYPRSVFVESGGLMSYGRDPNEAVQRVPLMIDKILKGAKPADLPVEQPTKFEFVINLKAAKQIGLTIPPNVLARADRVIR